MCRADGKFQYIDFTLSVLKKKAIFFTFYRKLLIQNQVTERGNMKIKGQYVIHGKLTKTTQCVVSHMLTHNRCVYIYIYIYTYIYICLHTSQCLSLCSWLYKAVIEMQNTETMILRTVRWKTQFTEILYSISNRKIMLDESLFYFILGISEYLIWPIDLPPSSLL
jgi:hypothetical protein